MNRGKVGEERGGKETDGYFLTDSRRLRIRPNMSPTQPADPLDQACERLTGSGLFKDLD
jgi:hypothetical protein